MGDPMQYRTESDSMGEVKVPADALYGASTQRAVQNFQISGEPVGRRLIWAFGLLKGSVASVAGDRGELDADIAVALRSAADEVMSGRWDDQFPVDIFQTGSGTSTNTNANEVIARLATEQLAASRPTGVARGKTVHPNDHANYAQSSNDTFPTAIHLAVVDATETTLVPALTELRDALSRKADEFASALKSGRTHLMDAVPMTLGQEFSGYRVQIEKAIGRVRAVVPEVSELALGGTAIGTGLNAPAGFAADVIRLINERTGYGFVEAPNHFEAQAAKDGAVSFSGALKTVAVSMFKIANDLRWLSSGPVTGIAEITLPPLQPGSSIMPAKVNPVIPEVVMMVAAQVAGNDAAVTWGGANGNFELNVMMPLIARNLIESIELVAAAARSLAGKCVVGIEVDRDRALGLLERNVIIVTALNPLIGYDNGSRVAKRAFAERRSVRDVVIEEGLLSSEEVDAALDLTSMAAGGAT